MLLPYRAKNPPDRFPVVTLIIIIVNVLVYAVTSDCFLTIRDSMVEQYALSHATFSLLRVLTSMFLHQNILHIAGNMLFLWIFGSALEGRIGPGKYLALYLASGMSGDILHDIVLGTAHPLLFSLGASGAIMGVVGAYLYVFPFSTVCVFVMFAMRFSVHEFQARWVILFYVLMDMLEALMFAGKDGVGHLAHLGGAGVGFALVLILRVKRDTRTVSAAQAVHAELKDYSLLSLDELSALSQKPDPGIDVIMAYCSKCIDKTGGGRPDLCLAAIKEHQTLLMAKGDVNLVAWLILQIPPHIGGMAPIFYLRLATQLEKVYSNEYAAGLYRRVYELDPSGPDTETALYRLARLMESAFQNRAQAVGIYSEQLRRFPHGRFALEAEAAIKGM